MAPNIFLAKRQGCEIKIKSAIYIPPKENTMGNKKEKDKDKESENENVKESHVGTSEGSTEVEYIQPFHSIIKDIQKMRNTYPKGTINNLLYKEMGNSIYVNVVRGM
jgi:hypothetical protein